MRPVNGRCPACGTWVFIAPDAVPPQWACIDPDCAHGKSQPFTDDIPTTEWWATANFMATNGGGLGQSPIRAIVDPPGFCRCCGVVIHLMVYRGTGWCSQQCEKGTCDHAGRPTRQ